MKLLNFRIYWWIHIFICILFTCKPVQANQCLYIFTNPTGENAVNKIFRSSRKSKNIYEPGRCHENVYRFLKLLNPKDQMKFQVIAIFPFDRKTRQMYQFYQRSKEVINKQGISCNFHHVIAIADGYVYDLSNKTSDPMKVDKYFVKMYGIDAQTSLPSPLREFDWDNQLVARRIPVSDYLSETNSIFTYRKIQDEKYPLKTISELLF